MRAAVVDVERSAALSRAQRVGLVERPHLVRALAVGGGRGRPAAVDGHEREAQQGHQLRASAPHRAPLYRHVDERAPLRPRAVVAIDASLPSSSVQHDQVCAERSPIRQ